jgi:hypothetical protein
MIKKTSLDELSKHQQMDTRTIENMWLLLLAVEVYVIVSSGSVWTIIIQSNCIKQYKM